MKQIKMFAVTAILSSALYACGDVNASQQPSDQLIVVAEMKVRPGNVTVSAMGEIFSTIHPLCSPDFQLVKITGTKTFEVFPDQTWQRNAKMPATETTFDSPLGITTDENNQVWVIDLGLRYGKTRLFAFDAKTKKQSFALTFPETVAPKGSFIQDLAVDAKNGFVYLADIANPGILVVNTKTKNVKRLKQHPSFLTENVDMVIDKKIINFGGKPARIAVNPITISADKETIFYGAMNGKTWYSISAKAIRDNLLDEQILSTIKIVGAKPISDGAATDENGNHYFTNLNDKGIDVLKNGSSILDSIIRDERLDWADNVNAAKDGYLYIAINQLYKTPAFTGDKDLGMPPYFIYKVKK